MSSSPKLTKFYLRTEDIGGEGGQDDGVTHDDVPVQPTIRALRTMPSKENSVSVDSQDSTETTRTVSTDSNGNNRVRISRNDQYFEYPNNESKVPSSPIFNFPTFDDLFATGGKAKLNLRRLPSCFMGSSIEEEDEDTFAEDDEPTYQRQDTLMKMNFADMVYNSWENSKGFAGFHRRLGGFILHKYCMCCRPNVTAFLFLHVLYGISITSAGFVCMLECGEDMWIPGYLVLDGILSVLMFPILIMNWDKRIGGCVNEEEAIGRGTCWIVCFITRLLVITAGGVVFILYRKYLISPPEDVACQLQYFAAVGAFGFATTFVILIVIIPILFYVCLYLHTPRCCR